MTDPYAGGESSAPLAGSAEAPEDVAQRYATWEWEVAWQYGVPAITYRLSGPGDEVRYLKLTSGEAYPSLSDEAARFRWAIEFLPVPRVIEEGSADGVSWLITAGLPGVDATRLGEEPGRIVRALARGLRTIHGAPAGTCPFDFGLDAAVSHAKRRLDDGLIDPARDFHPEFEHLSAAAAIDRLEQTRPALEHPVVCHGDYCLPNVMIEGGVATGFLDLGELGVADRWWDLAVATWSVTWNLGPGLENLFLDEYGVERDERRVDFFRLLYDVVS